MPLKTVVESLDGIEDAYRDLYAEKGGKFILQVDGIDDHPSVVALKNGHTNSKRERDEAKRELADLKRKIEALPEDFDADEWERLRADEQARMADPDNKNVRQQIDAATAAVKQQYENKIAAIKRANDAAVAEMKADRDALERDLHSTLAIDGLKSALVKAGVKPTLMRAATSMFERDVEVVVEDGKRFARMKSDLGATPIEDFITNWAQGDEAKDFIAPPKGDDERGSGRLLRNGEANPFAKSGWNKTEQVKAKADPARAERLARAAGFKDLDTGLKSIRPHDA